ncbi:MAG: 5-(carboxyamino)imidazole ribonucleotide synthase [Halioglobus sp.]|jgi:5-(carboxyamino)imidazole ribonucleotide synthase
MIVRLGIIGGGQLALYLSEAARSLGIQVCILSESLEDVALQSADKIFVGALDDLQLVEQLIEVCDVITFDKEDVPGETLEFLLEAQEQRRISTDPCAGTLKMLKDKALQKSWMQENNLPTLPFYILPESAGAIEFPPELFGSQLVQKARCGGYDGRGVQLLLGEHPLRELWDTPSIVEPYLNDSREISIITARAKNGDVETYPPLSMDFDHQLNSVQTVSMPADISVELCTAATALAEKVVTLLDGVGVFAIEMFVTPDGELLINEISPRVHNSGHLTLDACNVSQFEQHVRAVTGLPLGKIKAKTPGAMVNILYTEALRENCPAKPGVYREKESGASIYWYGKAPGNIGRKMGHINAVAKSVNSALKKANQAMSQLNSQQGGKAA